MNREIHYNLADIVREKQPIIHCITNYVTAQAVANVILACGASPIMADHPEEVREVTAISSCLLLNLGTLKERSGLSMIRAGRTANELGIPIVLDPVGAGSSRHRTEAAVEVIKQVHPSVIRGNATELKAVLKGLKGETMIQASRGVDGAFCDVGSEMSKTVFLENAKSLCDITGAVAVMTGAVDFVVSPDETWKIKNGCSMMSRITGSGCMLDGLIAAYMGTALLPYRESGFKDFCPDISLARIPQLSTAIFTAAGLATALSGLCGQRAAEKTQQVQGGTGSFCRFFLDEISLSDEKLLKGGAEIEIQ